MKTLSFLMFITIWAAAAKAQSNKTHDGHLPPEPTEPSDRNHTTAAPTTVPPITTPKPTRKSTTVSTTTTAKPTTTKSTTTQSTSTAKPTTPATTVAPKPTPIPPEPKPTDPTIGKWSYKDELNKTCIMLQFAMQIRIPYNTTFNKTYTAPVNVPSQNVVVSGNCTGNQTIKLSFKSSSDPASENWVALNFEKNNSTQKYQLDSIQVQLIADNTSFPGYNGSTILNFIHNHTEFETSLDRSYKCAKEQQLKLNNTNTAEKPSEAGVIIVKSLQFEAYHDSTNTQFSAAEDCLLPDTPDAVPIAVGCALAALVIIVLVVYLIGRRRRQARGYLSM